MCNQCTQRDAMDATAQALFDQNVALVETMLDDGIPPARVRDAFRMLLAVAVLENTGGVVSMASRALVDVALANRRARAEQPTPGAGMFFKPEDIVIVRNEHGGEVVGYRYEPEHGAFDPSMS